MKNDRILSVWPKYRWQAIVGTNKRLDYWLIYASLIHCVPYSIVHSKNNACFFLYAVIIYQYPGLLQSYFIIWYLLQSHWSNPDELINHKDIRMMICQQNKWSYVHIHMMIRFITCFYNMSLAGIISPVESAMHSPIDHTNNYQQAIIPEAAFDQHLQVSINSELVPIP